MKRLASFLLCTYIASCVWVNSGAETVHETWVARYNGTGNGYDEPWAIALDGNGNVYVTGRSYGAGTDFDFATLKYTSGGELVWAKKYNGPGNAVDFALSLVVDDEANVYVTGYSMGDSTGLDFATLKYDTHGNLIWSRRYGDSYNLEERPEEIAVDLDGSVYVTGGATAGSNFNYLTLKYSPTGDLLWVREYNGPDNDYDFATALATDRNGHVYVTGGSYSDSTRTDFTTIQYDTNGNVGWVRSFSGPGSRDDIPSDVVIDDSGNVYVTGNVDGGATGTDFCTIKYSPAGDSLWAKQYSGTTLYGNDHSRSAAIARDGSAFVTGFVSNPTTAWDYATIKYSPNGDELWASQYSGSADDQALDLALDEYDNLYVTGTVFSPQTFNDIVTIKYTADGNIAWSATYSNPDVLDHDIGRVLAAGKCGEVYVAGGSYGSYSSQTGYDYVIIRYSSSTKSGELNGDGTLNIADLVYLINIFFKSWSIPDPACLADVNGDSRLTLADVVYLANHVFKSGSAPVKSGPCCN